MRYGYDCCLKYHHLYLIELSSYHFLDEFVCFFINACCGLVHQQYFWLSLDKKIGTMRALAMQMSCFCPREKLEPESSILV